MLNNDYQELSGQLHNTKQKYKRAALLLTDFLEDLISNNPNIL